MKAFRGRLALSGEGSPGCWLMNDDGDVSIEADSLTSFCFDLIPRDAKYVFASSSNVSSLRRRRMSSDRNTDRCFSNSSLDIILA